MTNLFAGFSWGRVIVATIIAQAVGTIWYGPLFSKLYQKELKVTDAQVKAAQGGGAASMMKMMIREILSRLVFFLGLGLLLQYVGLDHKWAIGLFYFAAVVATECSAVVWSNGLTWRMFAMRAGKVAIDLVIALWLYGML